LNDELHNNDKKILTLLIQDDSSRFSFTGMKRKLNVHQQSLARALARLEELGLVEKSDAGYGLNKNAEVFTSPGKIAKPSPVFSNSSINFQLLHARIPVQIEVQQILIGLHGKWFDKYRFVELKKTDNGYALHWVNEATSFELILIIVRNYCVIETNAVSGESRLEAMFGASRIIKEITRILRRKLDDFRVRTIKINDISLTEHVN
jgi:DNA-binding Lrp family transcriptional regulator